MPVQDEVGQQLLLTGMDSRNLPAGVSDPKLAQELDPKASRHAIPHFGSHAYLDRRPFKYSKIVAWNESKHFMAWSL
jgi:hypothetical protein